MSVDANFHRSEGFSSMNDIVYAGKHSVTLSVSRHAHESWELIYCTGGQGHFDFDDDFSLPYEKGTIVVIPPNTPHSNGSTEGFTNIHLNMTNTTLNFKAPLSIMDDSNQFIYNAFSAAFFHFYSDPDRKPMLLSAYGDLIACYLSAYRKVNRLSPIVEEIESNIIQNYPDCNYMLDEYLLSLHFSYDYLRKLFKKELGVTPHKYLQDKRLNTAADMLRSNYNDSGSIAEIAQTCGFREPLYFSRMFKKKYGVAPSYYMNSVESEAPDPNQTSDSMKIIL